MYTILVLILFNQITLADDKELQPYVDSYLSMLKEECPNFKIKNKLEVTFVDVERKKTNDVQQIGLCTTYPYMYLHDIRIAKWWFKEANEVYKHKLIYHELTHCLLDKRHVNDVNHYMNPDLDPLDTKPTIKSDLIKQTREDMKQFCKDI